MPAWHLQRSRWIKGWLQSWSVHMAAPFLLGGVPGLWRFLTLQITLGFTLLSVWFYLPAVTFTAIALLVLYLCDMTINIAPLYLFSADLSLFAGILIGVVGALRSGKSHLIWYSLFMPAYWMLHFAPVLRATWELKRNPFYWHKTRHGIMARPDPVVTGNSMREPALHEFI